MYVQQYKIFAIAKGLQKIADSNIKNWSEIITKLFLEISLRGTN